MKDSHKITKFVYFFTDIKVLEDKIITFVKTELKRLRKTVNNDSPPHCGDSVEELNNAREGALKITLHFLRDMAENNLADLVEKCMSFLFKLQWVKKIFRSPLHLHAKIFFFHQSSLTMGMEPTVLHCEH